MPNQCPLCGIDFSLTPSMDSHDAPCPNCGSLVWFNENHEYPVSVVGMSFLESTAQSTAGNWITNNISVYILDFSRVEHLSSALLGKLITMQKKIKAVGKTIKIAGLNSQSKEIFSVTKLDKLFDVYEQPGDAIADL